jgi:hypothetical protein
MIAAPVDNQPGSFQASKYTLFRRHGAGILDVNRYSRQTTSLAEWVRQLMGIT